MTTLHKQDQAFAARGATYYHDSHYPARRAYCPTNGHRDIPQGLFSRHYFNPEGMEIGLVIPDLFPVGMGVQVFEQPRVWGIPHNLYPLPQTSGV